MQGICPTESEEIRPLSHQIAGLSSQSRSLAPPLESAVASCYGNADLATTLSESGHDAYHISGLRRNDAEVSCQRGYCAGRIRVEPRRIESGKGRSRMGGGGSGPRRRRSDSRLCFGTWLTCRRLRLCLLLSPPCGVSVSAGQRSEQGARRRVRCGRVPAAGRTAMKGAAVTPAAPSSTDWERRGRLAPMPPPSADQAPPPQR